MDPRFLDLALGLIVLEGLGLTLWRRTTGAGPRAIWPNLASGALLILVARGLLTGAAWVVLPLTGALIAHGLDIAARWEPGGGRPKITECDNLP